MQSIADLKRAFAYGRYSSDLQREESIDAQFRAIQQYAEQNGYTLLGKYADKGISGTTDQRPQFQRMIEDAKSGQVDAIIVHKLDRFARNRADSAIYRKELSKRSIRLLSVLENFDDSPETVILESVIEGYNEYYSKNLRREVMKGLKENALSCRHTGGTPCLGYDVDKSTMKLVINEYEAAAVRLIFKMYLENESYTDIIDTLNRSGYRTKRGALFGKNSLYEILRNEKYSGVYIYNKSASKNSEGKFNRHQNKNDEEIIRVDGGVPQIISKEDFSKVQQKMAERKQRTAAFNARQEYLLSGKIKCGICGCTYAGSSRKPNETHPIYISYRCTKKNGTVKCKNHEIQRDFLEEIVLQKLSDYVFNKTLLPELIAKYNDYAASKNIAMSNEIKAIKGQLLEINKKINNIVDVVMQTGSAALSDKLRELEDNRAQLECTLQEKEMKLAEASIDEKQLKSAFRKAKHMLKTGTLKNKKMIIERYVKQITMYQDKIEIEFNISNTFTIKQDISRRNSKK